MSRGHVFVKKVCVSLNKVSVCLQVKRTVFLFVVLLLLPLLFETVSQSVSVKTEQMETQRSLRRVTVVQLSLVCDCLFANTRLFPD